MQQEKYTCKGVQYVRINKREARQYFGEGKTIYLLPSKVLFRNNWISPCPIANISDFVIDKTFDTWVRDYESYNCNWEFGYHAKYYIKKEDLK